MGFFNEEDYGDVWVVGDHGVEPCTSSLSEKRSTDELATQYSL